MIYRYERGRTTLALGKADKVTERSVGRITYCT